MKTVNELSRIDGTWNRQQLSTLTIGELTAIYNMHVNDGSDPDSKDRQIKKFRTKEQGVERVHSILQDIFAECPLPAPTLFLRDLQKADQINPPQPTNFDPHQFDFDPTPIAAELDPNATDEEVEQAIRQQQQDRPTYSEAMAQTIEGTNIDGTTPTQPTIRRKRVKGIVKLCRELLKQFFSDATILDKLIQKYINEGGYDEKTARSGAQTILADTKKRLAALQL